jgi:hypothetical protein
VSVACPTGSGPGSNAVISGTQHAPTAPPYMHVSPRFQAPTPLDSQAQALAPLRLAPLDGIGSVAGVGGGEARHTRAW